MRRTTAENTAKKGNKKKINKVMMEVHALQISLGLRQQDRRKKGFDVDAMKREIIKTFTRRLT